MARCEDCLHSECCAGYEAGSIRRVLCGDKADERCKRFKSADDVVEVVRCHECAYGDNMSRKNELFTVCNRYGNGLLRMSPLDFCSYGRRRADDES